MDDKPVLGFITVVIKSLQMSVNWSFINTAASFLNVKWCPTINRTLRTVVKAET